MKSKSGVDKTASSAALLAVVGLLVANPVQASPDLEVTEITSEEGQTLVQETQPVIPMSEIETVSDLQFSTNAMDLEDPMAQVNDVSQLRDVSPGDWAFEALRNLVEHYGCIAGYPDGTFRGNRALSRYEFAAGLNACLQQIERLATGIDDGDLETIRRLLQEFEAELAALGARVDNLEGRVGFLEDHQFSTTTKLFGQVVVGFQGRTGNEFDYFLDRYEDDDDQINVITNTQLSLVTQFSPNSMLLTGLQAGTGSTVSDGPALGSYVGLGYEGNTDSDVILSDLAYRHLFGGEFAFLVGTEGVGAVNVFRGSNRVESAGFGPLSRFALRNPIISIGGSGGGVGFDWQPISRFSVQAVYASTLPGDPDRGGIFGAEDNFTTAGVQLVGTPVDNLDLSFQYINSYSPYGFLGTAVGDDLIVLPEGNTFRAPMSTNAFGAAIDWRIKPWITLGGWFGYTTSDVKEMSGNVETINWMAYLNFPDLFGEGNLGGIYVGQPPKIVDSDLPDGRNVPSFVNEGDIFAAEGDQPSTTTHIEAFYRFRVTDNIHITPGVIYLINPGQNDNNDDIVIGAIRTTFTF